MLLDYGISEPSASQLARLLHINPDYIAAHVQAAKDSPFGLGMAVYRMRYNWSASIVRRQKTRQENQREKMRKFLAGE